MLIIHISGNGNNDRTSNVDYRDKKFDFQISIIPNTEYDYLHVQGVPVVLGFYSPNKQNFTTAKLPVSKSE